jgi:ParB-like nuclease domain
MVTLHNSSKLISVEAINKNDWNPNFVTKIMQDTIVDDIRQNGFIGEIVIQKYNTRLERNNVIINGEHRFEALKKLGQKEIPVIILDIPDSKAKALSIRLNREHGELMPDKLSEILKSLSEDNDLVYLQEETGIPIKELDVLTEIKFDDTELEGEPKKQSTEKSVTCPFCNKKFTIYK